jgi:WD40 repeat protein
VRQEVKAAGELRAEKEQTARALKEARLNQAQLTMEHALKLCEEGEQGNYRDPYRGLLWLARALELAPADAHDLQRTLRLNWAAWQSDVCPLQGALPERATQIEWARAGKVLVALASSRLGCWDTVTGLAIPVPGHLPLQDEVLSCSADGRWAAAAFTPATVKRHGKSILVLDLEHNRLTELEAPHPAGITTLALSPDGSLILTGCADGKARLWERATGRPHGQPFVLPGPIRAVAFRPDGKVFAAGTRLAGSSRPTVRQWDVATRQAVGPRIQHNWDCHSLAYSPDGKQLLIAFGYIVFLFDTEKSKGSDPGFVHGESLTRTAFARDGEMVVGSTSTGETLVWDRMERRPLVAPITNRNIHLTMAVRPNGLQMATASQRDGVRIWQLPLAPPHLRLPEGSPRNSFYDEVGFSYPRSGLRTLAISPDGKCLATGGWNKSVDLWQAETGTRTGTLVGHDGVVTSLAFGRDGKHLLSGSTDKTARLWDVRTGTLVGRPFNHRSFVYGVALSSNGEQILTAGKDGVCTLWKATGERLKEWKLHVTSPVWSVAFSPDGQTGAATLWQKVAFCHLAAPYKTVSVPAGSHHVLGLAFSRDCKRFIAGGLDKTAQVRETQSRKPVGLSLNHRERIFPIDEGNRTNPFTWMTVAPWNRPRLLSVAFHPEGRIVATGDQGRMARLWDADTGAPIGPPLEHPGGVHALAFTPDGRYLLSASSDHVVRRWPVPTVVEDDPALLMLRTQVITGMELVDGQARLLDANAWQKRQGQLGKRGIASGPP